MQIAKTFQKMAKSKKNHIDNWENWQLIIIGGGAALCALYWSLMLTNVTSPLIEATNKYGVTWLALALWLLLGIFAAGAWIYGCIATKCHQVLFARMFRKRT